MVSSEKKANESAVLFFPIDRYAVILHINHQWLEDAINPSQCFTFEHLILFMENHVIGFKNQSIEFRFMHLFILHSLS